jgi:hypothetical protein
MRKIYVVLFILIGLTDLISQENRTFTGEGNNLLHLDWGSAESQVLRQTTVNYADGFSQVNDSLLPSPRVISNYVFDQTDNIFDSHNLSDYVWVFGQFIDHDITLVESDNREPILLEIPEDDEHFSPAYFAGIS